MTTLKWLQSLDKNFAQTYTVKRKKGQLQFLLSPLEINGCTFCNYSVHLRRKWFQRYVFTAPKARRPTWFCTIRSKGPVSYWAYYIFKEASPERESGGTVTCLSPKRIHHVIIMRPEGFEGLEKGPTLLSGKSLIYTGIMGSSMLDSLHRVFVKYHTQIFFQKKSTLHSKLSSSAGCLLSPNKKQVSVGNNGWKWR